jgi:phage shock protein PspC (stress-responsive transcriptional regulator)
VTRTDDFFDRIRHSGMVRPAGGRWFAGVAAALARRSGVDPLLIRGLFVVLAIFGIGFLLYGLAWALLPEADGRIHAQQAIRGDIRAGFVGAAILVLIDLLPGSSGFSVSDVRILGPWPGVPLALLVVAGVVVWFAVRNRPDPTPPGPTPPGQPAPYDGGPSTTAAAGTSPHGSAPYGSAPYAPTPYGSVPYGGPTPPTGGGPPTSSGYAPAPPPAPDHFAPSHTLTRATLGAALLAAAAAVLWDRYVADIADSRGLLASAAALVVIALGIVVTGFIGRRAGGLAPIGILLAIVVAAWAALAQSSLALGIGDRTWAPTTLAAATDGYSLGAGQVRAVLTDPALRSGATPGDPVRVATRVGVGHLVVVVPDGVDVEVEASAGAGEIVDRTGGSALTYDGGSNAGVRRTLRIGPGSDSATMVVTAEVGLGQVEIVTGTPTSLGLGDAATTVRRAPVGDPAGVTR